MKVLSSILFVALAGGIGLSFSSPTAKTPATITAEEVEYAVDPGHSSIVFRTKHIGVSYFYGRFNAMEGKVMWNADDPEASTIMLEVDANSVDTNSEGRDKHLRSPDFFSVKEYPKIVFESTGVKAKGDDLMVTGKLTLHGVTKEVTAKVQHTGAANHPRFGERVGFEATFQIMARDYEISFMTQDESAIGPEVDLTISLECVKQ